MYYEYKLNIIKYNCELCHLYKQVSLEHLIHGQSGTSLASGKYYMPLGVTLFSLAGFDADVFFSLLNQISFSEAGFTSFLLSFHIHAPEVTAAFSVLPIPRLN